MNMMEAEQLLRLVVAERGANQATMRQLGNQEWVVIIKTRGLDWWVWEPNQYQEYRTARTCNLCQREAQVKPCSSCKRLVCLTCRRILNGLKCLECYLGVDAADTPFITAQ